MLLSDILESLQYGELSQVSASNFNLNEDKDRKRIISNINLGLTEIYKRLPLKLKEVIIQQYPHIATYELLDKFSQTKGTETYKYIEDSSYDEFHESEVIRVDQIYTEDREEIPLNNDRAIYSIFTPTANSLQIPYPEEENAISVIYKAKPKTISVDAPNSTYVEIPDFLLEPLLTYVASRFLMTVNSETNDTPNYFAKFEGLIQNINMLGLVNKDNFSNEKVYYDGWV